ncbi:MAG: polysaccharide deacetylase family protein [Deltaproteobacteria bacterium]|nr:polysaccharide deacetylase family protein [Deltaproteobacteria bacterium]
MINFRLDRFLTLHFFNRIVKKQSSVDNDRIPILMYHSISDEKETSHPYYHVNTSQAVFDAHMRYLHENNYAVISLADLKSSFNTKNLFQHVVITFDDGLYDFLTNAFPILKKYNFGATVFLPTGFIHNARLSFNGRKCLTWNEVRKLSSEGINFGSHTVTHPQLSNLSTKGIENEIKLSKYRIEDETGITVKSFSCPYAFPENKEFGITLRTLLEECGYTSGVTTRIGTARKADDVFFQSRLPANSADDILLFRAKLEGAYDWLSQPQRFIKRFKGK